MGAQRFPVQRAARPPSSWVVENDGRSHVTSLNLSFFTHKRGDGHLHGGRSRGGGRTTGMLECAPKPTSRHVQSWPLTRRVPGKTHQVASTRVVLLSGALLKAPGTKWSQLPTPPPKPPAFLKLGQGGDVYWGTARARTQTSSPPSLSSSIIKVLLEGFLLSQPRCLHGKRDF